MTEPKEPDVVPLDDPSVPYSLVPLGDGTDARSLVGKIRLFVERMRALGGIPEYCALAWELCNENESLRSELDRVRAAAAPASQPQPETTEQFRYRLLAGAYERLNICPDHRGKTGDYCVICKAAQRTREELRGAVPASPWQPISSAPKDGKSIVALNAATGGARVCNWTTSGWAFYQRKRGAPIVVMLEPTHWMPLPPLPDPPAPHRSEKDNDDDQSVSR